MIRVNTDLIEFTDDYVYLLDGKPFTGVGYETDDDGVIRLEIEFQSGMQHGITREFYPTGQLKREAQYQQNTLDGIVIEWDETGVLEREEAYERGVCLRRKARDLTGQLSVCYELNENDPLFSTLQLLRRVTFNSPPK
ncbi:hypothetical protein KIH39_15300 [Telmatocola sphagniphila]|uniref:Toxin-antitoxin system YwqK family antitoxin n=1 Tax=Telmatocola sphagniphila TaxID=1123043 RepID=A0A8E6EW55_9BACT|nr:hypothetical protein [Telmatocola sphagniphila]QVL30218.1 hypothetical protein KIH39_15300 [Telmatocola sphagniphila]